MPSTGMEADRWVLAAVDADVQVLELGAGELAVFDVERDESGAVLTGLGWTLERFQRRFGHHWVPGRVELSAGAVEFRPREPVASATPLALRLHEVDSIDAISKVFNKTVRVGVAGGHLLAFRCREPFAFAEQLRMAAGAVRATAA